VRRTLFYVLAFVMAAVCVRLGVWQLSRLSERRASNRLVEARLDSAVTPFAELPRDTALARYRRVTLDGVYDAAHELLLVGRSRNGSPGVYLFTPLRVEGSDTAVLVNRGWIYAPDAMTVADPERWREPGPVRVTGFVQTFHPDGPGGSAIADRPGALRRTDPEAIRARLPYPIAPVYVIAIQAEGDSARGAADSLPVRLSAPALDEGSHLSYAIQWFTFATIAVAGSSVMWWQERRRRSGVAELRAPAATHGT
jgi:surfeit locus 1 family protein